MRKSALVRLHDLAEAGTAGELRREGIPEEIAAFLDSRHSPEERSLALQAYSRLHVREHRHAREIASFLGFREPAMTGAAVEALAAMGDVGGFREQIAELLARPAAAAFAAKILLALAATDTLQDFEPQLRALLSRPETRGAAVQAIEIAGLVMEHRPAIDAVLDDQRPGREHADYVAALKAIAAVGLLDQNRYTPKLAWALTQRGDFDLMKEAVHLIAANGLDGNHCDRLAFMLHNQDDLVRLAAVAGIGASARSGESCVLDHAGDLASVMQTYLGHLHPGASSRPWTTALEAFAATGLEASRRVVLQVLAAGGQAEVASVILGLEQAGTLGRYREEILARSRDETTSFEVQRALLPAFRTQECTLEDQVRLAAPWYSSSPHFPAPYKAMIYECSGGGLDARLLLALVPRRTRATDQAVIAENDYRRIAFNMLIPLIQLPNLPFRPGEDLAEALADLVNKADLRESDLAQLRIARDALRKRYPALAALLGEKIEDLETRSRIAAWCTRLAWFLVIHIAFWGAFISVYPWCRWLQDVFWNTDLLKILGLYYINLAFLWIPFLLRRLLMPDHIRKALLGKAWHFDEAEYYHGSQVMRLTGGERLPLASLPVGCALVLAGESGLGKTMFLAHLAAAPRTAAVILAAGSCSGGIIDAISDKLPGRGTAATGLVDALVRNGRLLICMDNLEEADDRTRDGIVDFVENRPRCNIVITTNNAAHLRLPRDIPVYVLQPLRDDEVIRGFLLSRQDFLPEDATVRGEAFRARCNQFLEEKFQPAQPENVLTEWRLVLSKPRALVEAASRIGRDQPIESAAVLVSGGAPRGGA